jgi:hypothetical protein
VGSYTKVTIQQSLYTVRPVGWRSGPGHVILTMANGHAVEIRAHRPEGICLNPDASAGPRAHSSRRAQGSESAESPVFTASFRPLFGCRCDASKTVSSHVWRKQALDQAGIRKHRLQALQKKILQASKQSSVAKTGNRLRPPCGRRPGRAQLRQDEADEPAGARAGGIGGRVGESRDRDRRVPSRQYA